jgi:hypothetical protein
LKGWTRSTSAASCSCQTAPVAACRISKHDASCSAAAQQKAEETVRGTNRRTTLYSICAKTKAVLLPVGVSRDRLTYMQGQHPCKTLLQVERPGKVPFPSRSEHLPSQCLAPHCTTLGTCQKAFLCRP